MRVLLAQQGPYVPAHDGANKANRFLMEGLVRRGHACMAVLPVSPPTHPRTLAQLHAVVLRAGATAVRELSSSLHYTLNGVVARAFAPTAGAPDRRNLFLRDALLQSVSEFQPDVILSSCSDSGGTLLRAALDTRIPVVHVARCTAMLGVGPGSFSQDWEMDSLLRRTHRIIANSRYLQSYLQKWAGVRSEVLDLPTYGNPPFVADRYDTARYITMINPCLVKGLPIFLEVVRRCRDLPFAAVATWGITADDRRTLEREPNVTILPPRDDVYELLRQTRILLVPSLWQEAFGRVVVEALLVGVPVLASDVGGLAEAKLGVPPHPIPVRPIERYGSLFDERGVPSVDAPAQDIDPWIAALRPLVSDRGVYEEVSSGSHIAATSYVKSLSIEKAEAILLSSLEAKGGEAGEGEERLHDRLVRLNPMQRQQLLRRLAGAPKGAQRGQPVPGSESEQ